MSYSVRDYDPENPGDAERLAAMFNDFDSAWPGGFNRGMPDTAESIRERMRRKSRLAVCVVEHDGEFVGYADLQAQPGQTDMAYLPLLGARLHHHGRGVGKMLLREIVRRTTDLGFRQLTLGTWAGNTKAVPLYKKTGFHWVPDTNVFMRNFIPTALTIPAGRAFFAGRDWYDCLERDLAVAPDDVRWKGMKVFPYRFRDGDDFLHLVFDAASERLTALEMPDWSVSCSIPVEDAPAGSAVPIVWEITSRRSRPVEVVLLTEADPGLEVRVQERLVVQGDMRLARELRVSAEAQPRREGEPAHSVRSTLLVDGQPVVLETGVRVVRPIEISYGGQGLFPGREERVTVLLASNLDRPVTGTLALDPHPSIRCAEPVQTFTLSARLKAQCEFTVNAQEPGVHATRLRFQADQTFSGSRPVAFYAYQGPNALAGIDAEYEEYACLRSPGMEIFGRLRGGHLIVHATPSRRRMIAAPLAELGPPFLDWRARPPLYAARIDSGSGGAGLTMTAPSQEFPGLTVERTVSLLEGDLARIDYRVINTSDRPLPAQLRVAGHAELNQYLVLPTRDGLIREPMRVWGEFPQGGGDALAQGERYAESWVACEEEGHVCGLIWQGEPQEDGSRFPGLIYDLGEIPSHSHRALAPLYFVAGEGGWKTVRSWWRRLVQPSGIEEAFAPETVRVLEVRTDPAPALFLHERESIRVQVLNRRGRVLRGHLNLSGDGFEVEPAEFSLEGVERDHPFAADLQITAPTVPAGGFLNAFLDTGPATETFRIPLVRLGIGDDPDAVTVHPTLSPPFPLSQIRERDPGGEGMALSAERKAGDEEDEQMVVENGLLTLRIVPGFLGSLVSVERDGVNHLFSAYPHRRPFVWMNPWFGGVHPSMGWMGNDRLPRETFTGEPVERVGERGLRWKGARVICAPEHKDLRGFRLEVEYLTLPGGNVVALVSRWTNLSAARIATPGPVGMAAWVQPGGTRANAVAHWERDGERRHRRRGGFPADARSGPWAAVENPQTGDVVVLIATDPGAHAELEDFAQEGPHLAAAGPLTLEPHETRETVTWLVLCRELRQLDAYAGLARVRRLP